MPTITLLNYNLTTKPKPNAAALQFRLTAKHTPRKADYLDFNLNVSTAIKDAISASFAQLGLFLEFDQGDGQLVPLFGSDAGAIIQIDSSLDNYGRTMKFIRFGGDQSPLLSSLLRGMRAVRVTGYSGKPGNVKSRVLFDGFTRIGSFDAYGPSADIQCQDTSLAYSGKKLVYSLAPGSLRTRKSVLTEILDANGVPYGVLDLGPNDGGVVFKAISVGGDVLIFDWIRDFLTPTGPRRIKFVHGKFTVLPYDGSLPQAREFKSGDVKNLKITPPATDEANQVVISATVFAYIGPTGHRAEYKVTSSRAIYAPKVALKVQDHTSGVVSDLALSSTAIDREVSRVETWTEYDGGTIVGQTVREWGWYTPRACAQQQDGSGVVSYNSSFDVFKYDDGSWRVDAQESFQIIRQSTLKRIFDATTGILSSEELRGYRFLPLEDPIAHFADDTGTEAFSNGAFIAADGLAWQNGKEVLNIFGQPTDFTLTTYASDGTGTKIAAIGTSVSVTAFSTGTAFVPKPAYSPITDFAFYKIMGPANAKRYAYFSFPDLPGNPPPQTVVELYTTAYAPVDEQSYRKTVTVNSFISNAGVEASTLLPAISASSAVIVGVIPNIDVLTSHQTAQPATKTVIDQVRSDLNGTIKDPQQNDYCETLDELQAAGLELLRQHGAVLVDWDMPIDCLTEEGQTVTMNIPDLGGVVNLIAWNSSQTFNGQTCENNQHITARWYPPELAPA